MFAPIRGEYVFEEYGLAPQLTQTGVGSPNRHATCAAGGFSWDLLSRNLAKDYSAKPNSEQMLRPFCTSPFRESEATKNAIASRKEVVLALW